MRRARDIPAGIIKLRIAVAENLGADRGSILQEANIEPEFISNPKARITVEQTMQVWKAIVKETGLDTIGLECGIKARFQTMGILGYVMMNSSSILSAWNKLCTYQELVLSIVLHRIRTEGNRVIITGEMQEEWQDEFRYTLDFIYASSLTLIKNCTSKEIVPIEVGFNFPAPENIARYHEIFGPAKIKFSCESPYMIYNSSDLDKQITGTDPSIFEHFEILLEDSANEHNKINAQSRAVKNSIFRRLKAEIPRIDEVSRELAMSVRSLQDGLKKEGTTFQNILTDVRKEVAIKQLSRPEINITDVAFLSGFSDVSVFSRNFKKWTGLTPTEFKNQK
jgi:AraC-like DNA-binding protein